MQAYGGQVAYGILAFSHLIVDLVIPQSHRFWPQGHLYVYECIIRMHRYIDLAELLFLQPVQEFKNGRKVQVKAPETSSFYAGSYIKSNTASQVEEQNGRVLKEIRVVFYHFNPI